MKLILVLICGFGLLGVMGKSYAQMTKLSLSMKDVTVREVLQNIEENSEFSFMFDNNKVDVTRKVSVSVSNESIEEILKQLFAENQVKFEVIDRHIVLLPEEEVNSAQSVIQQQNVVSGKVTDSSGQPLPGVAVAVKGKTQGTVTDVNGNYSLTNVQPDAVLVFSFVGMKTQEIIPLERNVVDVRMEEMKIGVDEVIIIGYGTQSKRKVTGSISKVNLSRTFESSNTSITQSLRGSVAGVQMIDDGRAYQGSSILIRGPRSLSASNDPLIVLDGIIYGGNLNNINPFDIQSIEVLKDASASAIYGSKAANGVILITSKSGTAEKPSINFNLVTGISSAVTQVKTFSPERYVESKMDFLEQSGVSVDRSDPSKYLYADEAANYLDGNSTDPWDMIFRQGLQTTCDLSISGKTKTTKYYVSGSLVKIKGILENDNMERYSMRVNLDTDITEWLKIGLTSNFSRRDLSGVPASVGAAYRSSPWGNWFDDKGNVLRYIVSAEQADSSPLYNTLLTDEDELYNNLFSNIYAIVEIPFIEGLNYRMNFSPNFDWNHKYSFVKQDTYRTDNMTAASKYNYSNFQWVLENILTYDKRFGKNHALNLTLLYGRDYYENESTTANSSNMAQDQLGYNLLSLGQTMSVNSYASSVSGISSMLRANYIFKQKYLLTGTIRRDGSSVFSKKNKFATFPSGSVAWIASEEPFIKELSFIDMLKFRVSYGSLGNQAIAPYQSLDLATDTKYVYGDGGKTSIGVYPSSMANSELKWETTTTLNFGIDFDLLKNKIGGTIELYNSKTRDLLVRRSIPTMTGFSSVYTNLGEINNRGIELTLNTTNIKKNLFEWGTSIAFSYNRNRIIHLYYSDADGDGIEDDDISNSWFIGHPITSYYDFVFDGIYQQNDTNIPEGSKPGYVRLKNLDEDPKITADDRKIIGSGGQPDFKIGLTNNFSYGNFTLSVFVNAMLGWISDFPLLNTNKSPNAPGRGLNQLDAGYWTLENKSTTRPSIVYNNPYGHGWYISRDFVRIQDASLSYNFPKKILNQFHIPYLKLFVSAKNLYIFTDWLGSDPESGYTSYGSLDPMPRIFSIGLNLGL